MHELSIAQAVAAVALRHARGRRVERVEVRIGHLRQVVPDALAFAWEVVTHETGLEAAELEILDIAARGSCRACGAESELQGFPLACARCGSVDLEVVAGEELSVESLEVCEELSMSGGMQ